VCHLPQAGIFTVGWRRHRDGAALTHHGIADLPGTFEYAFTKNDTE
jgi:lipopolysaccharide transport system ATP-binding protein